MAPIHRSGVLKKTKDSAVFILTTILGLVFGFLIGISVPIFARYTIYLPSSHRSSVDAAVSNDQVFFAVKSPETTAGNVTLPPPPMFVNIFVPDFVFFSKKRIHRNPRVARLPPRIVVRESDLFLHRLWGLPTLDLRRKPKYLATFSVGVDQMNNIDACVKKFSEDFQILLFHYDGRTNKWDKFEWSKRAIHVSVKKQTKWWYAKRFLHPDVVSAYEYIFIWDEDLGVEHFDAERYIKLVKKHGLEISQPGIDPGNELTWEMTKRRDDQEVHKVTTERPGWCTDQHLPPCAAYAPSLTLSPTQFTLITTIACFAFSQFCGNFSACIFSGSLAMRMAYDSGRNDLVHGWGLDFALRRCVEDITKYGKSHRRGVRKRCNKEWSMFQNRLDSADDAYQAQFGKGSLKRAWHPWFKSKVLYFPQIPALVLMGKRLLLLLSANNGTTQDKISSGSVLFCPEKSATTGFLRYQNNQTAESAHCKGILGVGGPLGSTGDWETTFGIESWTTCLGLFL
ncbi:hypothetical protein V6N13_066267 [Hibiscus sabdariffa]|uniref:Uncharacterized protein n=1 Tax=Hibiscus sabdariffa TaxID=183260 RepID=A0ABR2DQ32_9ROSI